MPDFQDFAVTRNGTAQLTVPVWNVELRVTSSRTGETIRDFTGANRLRFPHILAQLTEEQQDEFVRESLAWLIRKRAGLD